MGIWGLCCYLFLVTWQAEGVGWDGTEEQDTATLAMNEEWPKEAKDWPGRCRPGL